MVEVEGELFTVLDECGCVRRSGVLAPKRAVRKIDEFSSTKSDDALGEVVCEW